MTFKSILLALTLSLVPALASASDYFECQGEAEEAALAAFRADYGYESTPSYDFWTDDVTDRTVAGSGKLTYDVFVNHYHNGDAATYQVELAPEGCKVLGTTAVASN